MIGAISGTISAKRNLQATINKLNQEKQRQQELLYKSEFQIAQMERTVARLMGERSMEDQKRIQAEIEERQTRLNESTKQLQLLAKQNQKLEDEIKLLQKKIEDIKNERLTLETAITELMVENEMAGNEVEAVKKGKEKVLVQHDCKKLEIKKLRDTVNLEADQVYGLENRKYQLEMSMEEREKEI